MSLQEDVNNQVEAIHANLDLASLAAGQFEPTLVELSGPIDDIADQQESDNNPVVNVFLALCDAIDGLGGDTAAARAEITSIGNSVVDFVPVKNALTEMATVLGAVAGNLTHAATATGDHLNVSSGMVDLLIDQSNFGGAIE
jgi:hypothetical protein